MSHIVNLCSRTGISCGDDRTVYLMRKTVVETVQILESVAAIP